MSLFVGGFCNFLDIYSAMFVIVNNTSIFYKRAFSLHSKDIMSAPQKKKMYLCLCMQIHLCTILHN